jgi:hypothetical protein
MAAVDYLLLAVAAAFAYLLYLVAGDVVRHISCSVAFMAVAAAALVQAHTAKRMRDRALWYAITGCVFAAFVYFALTYVFRPPRPKTAAPCGGVHYVHADGATSQSQGPHDEL